jgi:plastocyanin
MRLLLIAFALAAAPVDPRTGGLEVALGEWTLVPEARAIRPGRVTLVVRNRGRFRHALRIRSSGDGGGGERLEVRSPIVPPGGTVRLTVDLPAGTYDFECPVEDGHGDHEARGMRAVVQVRANAPLVRPKPAAKPNAVAIRAFAFRPATITVRRGRTVRWTNQDAAPHTVSAASGAFTSQTLRKGQTYARTFRSAGRFAYLCAIHPQMKAAVVVR